MKSRKLIFLVYFLIVTATFIYSNITDSDLVSVSMIGHYFFMFGLFSFLEEWKSSGKELLKDPLVLFFSIFILVGIIMMFIPLIVNYQHIITKIFRMDMGLLAALVFGIVFIMAGIFFVCFGFKSKTERKKHNYTNETFEVDKKLENGFIILGFLFAGSVAIVVLFVLINS